MIMLGSAQRLCPKVKLHYLDDAPAVNETETGLL